MAATVLKMESKQHGYNLRPRPRLQKLVNDDRHFDPLPHVEQESADEVRHFSPVPHGESGDDSITSIPFQVLSWKPRAVYFPDFATAEQCQSIIKMAKNRLTPSAVVLREGQIVETNQGIRTSSGMFIRASEDKSGILNVIEEKIARATMIPRSHGEEFIVLSYEVGQKFSCHYDTFSPVDKQQSQRIASFLLYLSDVEEGGETMFPYKNGFHMYGNYDFHKCIGMKVKPRQGDGLLFYSLFPNGTIDRMSLHGSCPVIKGEKWVATKWIRDHRRGRRWIKN
ncbi:probable prolyl 4-hydroxylase 9 [Cornus florida]|uniref:probable prolyl 4-hydroxylase 9 n=1 Tax=Cornus florida TaxID=4283 RepID=UPI00289EFEFE|nr:probable prolyl 4-hydroxylase 9 [Cornus florida]